MLTETNQSNREENLFSDLHLQKTVLFHSEHSLLMPFDDLNEIINSNPIARNESYFLLSYSNYSSIWRMNSIEKVEDLMNCHFLAVLDRCQLLFSFRFLLDVEYKPDEIYPISIQETFREKITQLDILNEMIIPEDVVFVLLLISPFLEILVGPIDDIHDNDLRMKIKVD